MIVAIDATPLTLTSGGILRYTQELSRALATQFPDDDFCLVSDQSFQLPWPCPGNLRRGAGPRNWGEERWWLHGVQREMSRNDAGLFHGTNFAVPWLPFQPSVLTLHDLSPWLDRVWQPRAGFIRRRTPAMVGLGLATMIVTPSEAIRRQVIDRFHVHPDRIAAVPHAASEHFRPAEGPPRATPYFLCVGVLEPRKNLGMLVDAWREVHRRCGVELVLAGRCRDDFQAPAPEAGLRVLGEVPERDLPGLYSGAVACFYPSLYEGFGLPVLEAMQCGALVIASRDPSISELAGGGALLLDACDPAAWVEAMTAAVSQPASMAGRRELALERARQYSWNNTARRTHEVYLEAAARFGR